MAGYHWIDWNASRMVPSSAVRGGTDKDGSDIYVGRAFHEGDWIPAKVIPERHTAYIAHGGGEHVKDNFQVLCEQRFDWVPTSGGNIPMDAVEGGRTENGEPLYVGRVWHDGAHTVGKVHPSHGCCYIPYDSQEMCFCDYEILVLRNELFLTKPATMAEEIGFKSEFTCPSIPHSDVNMCYSPGEYHPPVPVVPTQFPSYSHEDNYFIDEGCKAYYWNDWAADRMVPSTAVHGGVDKDGSDIYVGRAFHEGDWIPAKVIPEHHIAYVAYAGEEHVKETFQVLCEQRFDWVASSGGHIPPGAVKGGRTVSGEALYIGRVWHDGAHSVGKVHSSHGCCYIPYDSREMSFCDYEILVLRH
ncbi:hypothetical protein FQA39_LY01603 [Lamprigera yunnana]|nr:hypothetical protein FQA39_LY01603 [Lamprigera yunnana]